MKGLFKKSESELCAKLCTLKSGGTAPIFMKAVIAANARNTYNGIPVIYIGGCMMGVDYDVNELTISGTVENPRDVKLLSDVGKLIGSLDLNKYAKAQFGWIFVYEASDTLKSVGDDALFDSGVIEFKRITKFKYRPNGITVQGLTDIAGGKKNFVVDTEVE